MADQAEPIKSKDSWYRRRWVIGAAAVVVGIGIGGVSAAADPKDSSEYKNVSKMLSTTREDLAESKAELEVAAPKAEQVDAVDDREKALDARESDLNSQEKDIDAEKKELTKREKAVGIKQQEIEDNTISGDGMYEVGVDIKSGTYKTKGQPGCYYSVLNSPDNFDIANNGNIDGPGVASVSKGQYFSVQGCADWVRQ